MNRLNYLKTLLSIRDNFGYISLKSLFNYNKEAFYSTHHNSYTIFYLLELYKQGYIEILDNNKNDCSDTIFSIRDDDIIQLMMIDTPSIVDTIFIKLTDKLPLIQQFLGFSLHDTIKKLENWNSIVVTPFFSYPSTSLKNDVFAIMPFSEEYNHLYQDHIKAVCKSINKSCIRADDLYTSRSIMQDIWDLIYNSKVIIADCTNKNPNVMYELGIAHAIGKKVILITQNIDDIPFDLRHLRHLHYQYAPHSIVAFEDKLSLAIQESLSDNLDDVF